MDILQGIDIYLVSRAIQICQVYFDDMFLSAKQPMMYQSTMLFAVIWSVDYGNIPPKKPWKR